MLPAAEDRSLGPLGTAVGTLGTVAAFEALPLPRQGLGQGGQGGPGQASCADDSSRSSLCSESPPLSRHGMLDLSPNPSSMLSFLNAGANGLAGGGFLLGNPPLAALHSMTEMKNGPLYSHLSPGSGKTSPNSSTSSGHTTTGIPGVVANPHGIDHILSRPAAVTVPGASPQSRGARQPDTGYSLLFLFLFVVFGIESSSRRVGQNSITCRIWRPAATIGKFKLLTK